MDIQAPELSRALARMFNVVGPATSIRALDSVVYPVVVVDVVQSAGKRRSAGFAASIPAGGVNTFNRLRLTNPVTSRSIIYPRWFSGRASASTAISLFVGVSGVITPAVSNCVLLDPIGVLAEAKVDVDTPLVLQGGKAFVWACGSNAGVTAAPLDGIKLLPGDTIAVQESLAGNLVVDLGLLWEEEPVP